MTGMTASERDVAEWIRDTLLPKTYKKKFSKKKVKLTPGGVFEFAAVSDDDTVIANISTASYRDTQSITGVGKMHQIRSDAFFLLLAEADKKVIVFAEPDMHEAWQKEQISGRMPSDIRLIKAELPGALRRRLDASK